MSGASCPRKKTNCTQRESASAAARSASHARANRVPLAFAVLVAYAVLWYIFKPETLEWHAVATLATLGMTLVIQRAEHRDTQAIHAKLDEVLHALGDARNEMTRVDEEEPEEIEQRRDRMRKDD